MKRLLFTLVILVFSTGLSTAARHYNEDAYPEAVRNAIDMLVRHANVDYPERRGTVFTDNDEQTLYKATVPYHYLNTDGQYVSVLKKNKQAFFLAVYNSAGAIDLATEAITNFDEPKQQYSLWSFDKKNYSAKHSMQKNADGYLTDTVFYKTVPVAVLNINPEGNTAIIMIGVFNSKNLAADKALLPQMVEQPYSSGSPFEHMSVNGNIITVHGWGKDFDGDYDVAALAKDSCVSGNCDIGKGRKVLASIVNGQPRIRIMQGKFRNHVFLGNGVMLVDEGNPAFDGTYELGPFDYSYMTNYIGVKKATFHTKAGNETFQGQFNGYLDYGIGSAIYTYRKFVVQKFNPNITGAPSPWMRDAYWPQLELENDIERATPHYRKEEAKRESDRIAFDRQKSYNQEHDKCGCCGGKGVTTQQDFVHYQGSGNNYMRYSSVKCTCCGGTGLKKDQTSYKPKDNGTVIIR